MSKKKNEVIQMSCIFYKDGSVKFIGMANLIGKPFMRRVRVALDEMADAWFDHVLACEEVCIEVKEFEIIVKI